MKVRRFCWLMLLLLLATASCRTGEEVAPTPFIQPSPTSDPANSAPITVAITDLAASPAFFEGANLRLTGQFKRLPKLVCPAEAFPSPATWGLVANGLLAQAGGFDTQLRSLIPDDLAMTIEGRWQRWQGPVGCGKKAVEQDIWYLAVTAIVAPSPLALVTLTPSAAGEPTEPAAIAEIIATETPTIPVDSDTPPELPPPDDGSTNPGNEELPPSEEATPFPDEELPPSDEETPPPDEDLPPSEEEGDSTATPTLDANAAPTTTPTPSSGTATATAAGNAPTATPNTIAGTVVEQDLLQAEDLAAARLEANQIHEWLYEVTVSEAITVSTVSADADLIITLLNPSGQQISETNNFAAGQVELLQNFTLSDEGEYKIRIRTSNGGATDYAIMITSSESYTFVFRGVLQYGDLEQATSKANNDHFWHFYGQADDVITINLTPQGSSDLFMELYGPDAERISQFIDDGNPGEAESLADFTLPATGIYSIRIGEFDFRPTTYQIELLGDELSQRGMTQTAL